MTHLYAWWIIWANCKSLFAFYIKGICIFLGHDILFISLRRLQSLPYMFIFEARCRVHYWHLKFVFALFCIISWKPFQAPVGALLHPLVSICFTALGLWIIWTGAYLVDDVEFISNYLLKRFTLFGPRVRFKCPSDELIRLKMEITLINEIADGRNYRKSHRFPRS